MEYPRVTFRVSRMKDARTAKAFIADARVFGDRMLEWAFYARYPELKGNLHDNKVLTNFLRECYTQSAVLHEQLLLSEKKWRKLERRYFTLVDELFVGHPWPKGRYVAYGTVWGMYPRFLEDKTFQIPYRHKRPKYIPVIIAHEMLHFMFYDYFACHFPEYRAKKYTDLIWRVSEVFNTVVENSPTWMHVFREPSLGYPEHESIERRIGKKYAKGDYSDVGALIRAIIKEVDNAF